MENWAKRPSLSVHVHSLWSLCLVFLGSAITSYLKSPQPQLHRHQAQPCNWRSNRDFSLKHISLLFFSAFLLQVKLPRMSDVERDRLGALPPPIMGPTLLARPRGHLSPRQHLNFEPPRETVASEISKAFGSLVF